MTDINNSVTKLIIDTRIQRMKEALKEDYTPRDEIDFVDVFFPKVCAIYGAEGCVAINDNKDINGIITKRGLSSLDFEEIESMMKSGVSFVTKNGNSLKSIFEMEQFYNDKLKAYAEKVMVHLEKEDKTSDISIMKKSIGDFFEVSPYVYEPCSSYEDLYDNGHNKKKM